VSVSTNNWILIIVALLFGYLLLAVHYEEKRSKDRRKVNLGPPGGIERRSGRDRRRDSLLHYLAWVLRSQLRRLGGVGKPKGTSGN
jgi:hypothetical protein